MSVYTAPGVYIKDNENASAITSKSSSTGGFIGITQRGKLGVPVLIESWNAFINNFAYGMDSPFISTGDLAYAVYGFFQNGGKKCYILRVAHSTASKAKIDLKTGETTNATITAKDEGAWGNSIKITVTANADTSANFDLKVTLDGETVEVFENLSNTTTDEKYWVTYLTSYSSFITGTGTLIVASETALATGAEGVSDIEDKDFTDNLVKFDVINDLRLLAIPGQTSSTLNTAVMTYCNNRKDVFCILDAPKASTVTSVKTLRKSMECTRGALCFPWIKVTDPLSKSGILRDCPLAGHLAGVYARIISTRGVWKAPAGTEAVVKGAIDVNVTLTKADLEVLNPLRVVTILPMTNYGIVVWGAGSLNADEKHMKYVSDVLLDMYIKQTVYDDTQRFVFEPNTPYTWSQIKTVIETFLNGLWKDGALVGTDSKDAYFVKCDADLNTADVIADGMIKCQIGYANSKPGEFIEFTFSHEVATS